MKQEHREIRAMLQGMAPKRAITYIQSFELSQEEAQCIAMQDTDDPTVKEALRQAVHVMENALRANFICNFICNSYVIFL